DGMRMRDIDGDEGDSVGGDLICDDRGCVLIDLELDDEIDLSSHEFFGNMDRGRRVVTVVEDDEFDASADGRLAQARSDSFGEGHLTALFAKSEAGLLWSAHHAIKAVRRVGEIATVHKSLEDPVHRGFGNIRLLVNRFQRQRLTVSMQDLKDIQRFGQHWDEVAWIDGRARQGISL